MSSTLQFITVLFKNKAGTSGHIKWHSSCKVWKYTDETPKVLYSTSNLTQHNFVNCTVNRWYAGFQTLQNFYQTVARFTGNVYISPFNSILYGYTFPNLAFCAVTRTVRENYSCHSPRIGLNCQCCHRLYIVLLCTDADVIPHIAVD